MNGWIQSTINSKGRICCDRYIYNCYLLRRLDQYSYLPSNLLKLIVRYFHARDEAHWFYKFRYYPASRKFGRILYMVSKMYQANVRVNETINTAKKNAKV